MASFPFLSLPRDVAVEILTHLDSPFDIRSILLVSRSFNALFRSTEHGILKSTIQNGLHAEVLVDAVAACRTPTPIPDLDPPGKMFRIQKDADKRPTKSFVAETREDILKDALAKVQFDAFVAKHRKWQAGEEPLGELDLRLCRSICRLWATVHVFADMFFCEVAGRFYRHIEENGLGRFTSQASYGLISPETLVASAMPSRLEKARIQRALFRFEILRRLFGPRNAYKGWRTTMLNTDGSEEIASILADYTHWEISEIRVVHSYIIGLWGQRLCSLSSTALQDAKKIVEEKGVGPTKVSWSEWEAMKHGCSRTDYSRLDVYTPSKPFNFLVGLGLPFLRKWLKLSPRDALSIAGTYQKSSDMDTFTSIDSMVNFTGNVIAERQARRKDGGLSPRTSTTELKSPGWFVERYGSKVDREPRYDYDYDSLQSLGVSFWDRERFERADLFKSVPAKLKPYPKDDLTSHCSNFEDVQVFAYSKLLSIRNPMVPNNVARDLMPEPLTRPRRKGQRGSRWDVSTNPGKGLRTVEDIMGNVEY